MLGHQSANCFEATHVIQVSVLYATVQVRDFLNILQKFRENTQIHEFTEYLYTYLLTLLQK